MTRCEIAKLERDGLGWACHLQNDGYPEWAGAMLDRYYKDPSKVDDLIRLGDLRSLGRNTHSQEIKVGDDGWKPTDWDGDDINHPDYEGCVSYHRDLGQSERMPGSHPDQLTAGFDTLNKRLENIYTDFIYVMTPNGGMVCQRARHSRLDAGC